MELKFNNEFEQLYNIWLLIVPYGIEIYAGTSGYVEQGSFNRTLWN